METLGKYICHAALLGAVMLVLYVAGFYCG